MNHPEATSAPQCMLIKGIIVSLTLNTETQAQIKSTGHSESYILHLPGDSSFVHMGK